MVKRRPGRLFALEVAILESGLLVQSEEDAFYGFALVRRMEQLAGGGAQVAHGALYKALARMAAAGLVEASWEDPGLAEQQGRPRRRLYTVTALGESTLAAEVRSQHAERAAHASAARGVAGGTVTA